MLCWLSHIWASRGSRCPWSVEVLGGIIRTSDGQGTTRELPVEYLRAVEVATDDSGPWGDDFVFLLYENGDDPVGLFPLEATGRAEFVEWLSSQPGYNDAELSNASASTRVARFKVYERPTP